MEKAGRKEGKKEGRKEGRWHWLVRFDERQVRGGERVESTSSSRPGPSRWYRFEHTVRSLLLLGSFSSPLYNLSV